MAKTNAFEVSGWIISALLSLTTMMAIIVTYVRWIKWAGTGWLW